MKKQTPAKKAYGVTHTIVTSLIAILTVSLTTQTSQAQPPIKVEQDILSAAIDLGVVKHKAAPRRQVAQPQRHVVPHHNRNTHQARIRQQHVQQQRARTVKHDPYKAKREQILRQNAERRRAHQQRLAQLQRGRYQKAHAQKTQQQNSHRNVWNRVYQGFQIRNNNNHPLTRRFIREFSRNPARIQRLADRSSDYLYMVVNELNRRGMPTELALLPFVESAYRNNAYSHAGAAGMWQFIRSTGRIYGLQQTRSYDARLDSHRATHAALNYLQKLNRQFRGDWLLALAAYNCGEYRVEREINKNRRLGRRTDYWSLDLPRETKQYVPRLLAFKEIFRNPRAYRVHLRGIPNSPALAKVNINKPVNLRKAAAYAGLPPERLLSLNSSYLHGITTPRYSRQIILPRRHAGRLLQVIQKLPPAADVHHKPARRHYAKYRKGKRTRYRYHKVRRGDNLYRIARKHGTTVKKLKRLNKLRSNRIKPGKRLKIASARYTRSRS